MVYATMFGYVGNGYVQPFYILRSWKSTSLQWRYEIHYPFCSVLLHFCSWPIMSCSQILKHIYIHDDGKWYNVITMLYISWTGKSKKEEKEDIQGRLGIWSIELLTLMLTLLLISRLFWRKKDILSYLSLNVIKVICYHHFYWS